MTHRLDMCMCIDSRQFLIKSNGNYSNCYQHDCYTLSRCFAIEKVTESYIIFP